MSKSSSDPAKALQTFIAKCMKSAPKDDSPLPDQDDPVAVLIQSFLMWEASEEKAVAAYAKIRKSFVDFNDLRVSMAPEVAAIIGTRYPAADDRCRRLRSALRAVYVRDHDMKMESAAAGGKRNIRRYVEQLDGTVPYVTERVLLVAFGVHAMPADESLRLRLVEAGALDGNSTAEDAVALLLKNVKAADALKTHRAIQAWMDANGAPKGTSPLAAMQPRTPSLRPGRPATAGTAASGGTKKSAAKAEPAAGKSSAKSSKSTKSASKTETKPAATSSSKTTTKKTTTKKTPTAKTTTKKSTTKKTTKKSTTKKTTAKTTTKKAPARKTTSRTTTKKKTTRAASSKKTTSRKTSGK